MICMIPGEAKLANPLTVLFLQASPDDEFFNNTL